ncbi:WLM-domain-containing protein [Backusella circina FSU 941]|nr:WLM-domain-containing protein [Backusella circina FSU 941]
MFQKKEVVDEYKVLKRKHNSEEALVILKKLVSQVKPIIRKRNWHVRYLCEFFPKNPNLLGCNVNRGYKINLRLRPHFDDTIFLEYNDILGTLLHELAHIVRGPHDEHFYKLLNELKAETEILMASGYSGEGFYSEGQRLGARSVPIYKSSQAAAAAAEKRRQLDRIMLPKGGITLGQSPRSPQLAHVTPAQMAASAAERRLRDNVWCGGSILVEDDDEEENDNNGDNNQSGSKRKAIDQPESSSSSVKRVKEPDEWIDLTEDDDNRMKEKQCDDGCWICSACTFLNGSIVLVCQICLTEKPIKEKKNKDDDDTWQCPQCTLRNGKEWSVCNACQYVYLR